MTKKNQQGIFDIEKIDDLPKEVVQQIKKDTGHTANILGLFKIKEPLSLNEILVGLFRGYKIQKSRQFIHSTLSNLIKIGRVERFIQENRVGTLYKLGKKERK